MTSRLRLFATAFALLVTASSLAGCSFEPGERTQLVGQECFGDEQCVSGAVCVERRCQYEASALTGDAGGEDARPDAPDAELVDVAPGMDSGFMDTPVADGGVAACRPSATRCISDTQIEYCRNDGTGFDTRTCQDGLRCTDGECVPVDADSCQYQDQVCSEEGMGDDYYCGDVFQLGQKRCVGICDSSADDPDSTCPDTDSKCLRVDGEEELGICLTKCTSAEGCDTPGYECDAGIGQGNEGVCVPRRD